MFSWLLAQGSSIQLARTGAVNMLVMGSAAYLINSRFLLRSTLSMAGLFGSRPVWVSIGTIVVLQLGWTYLPIMQVIFGSEGLTLGTWGVILVGSLAIYLIVELEKRVLRARGVSGYPAAKHRDQEQSVLESS